MDHLYFDDDIRTLTKLGHFTLVAGAKRDNQTFITKHHVGPCLVDIVWWILIFIYL